MPVLHVEPAIFRTPAEQATRLLRKVKVAGNVDDAPTPVPQLILGRVGQKVDLTREQLEAYLARKGISARDIGGPLNKGVSSTSNGTSARYFVIHDTSDEIKQNSFPSDINAASWPPNNLARRKTNSAHIFINRLGESVTGHNYSQGWRATKREQNAALKGLFLHHELVQPRIKGAFRSAAVGPEPGFTTPQMERLALCYLAASLRRGTWLIPAFHCVLDPASPTATTTRRISICSNGPAPSRKFSPMRARRRGRLPSRRPPPRRLGRWRTWRPPPWRT